MFMRRVLILTLVLSLTTVSCIHNPGLRAKAYDIMKADLVPGKDVADMTPTEQALILNQYAEVEAENTRRSVAIIGGMYLILNLLASIHYLSNQPENY